MPEPSTRLFYGRLAERYHLAVFGVSAVGEYDTSDALRAALELTRRLPSTPHVGVETGEAVIGAGRPGPVAGGPVDAAIQLRDAAPPGGYSPGRWRTPGARRLLVRNPDTLGGRIIELMQELRRDGSICDSYHGHCDCPRGLGFRPRPG